MIFKSMNIYIEKPLSSLKLYDKIVENKKKGCKAILTNNDEEDSIYKIIDKRYKEYEDRQKELENIDITAFSDEQIKCLKGCYGIETDGLTYLLTLLDSKKTNLEKSVCYYCGVGEPDTWDHYLPKEIFPEFSVYPNNLIPCCPTCNRIKKTKWIDQVTGHRKIVNFYFDKPTDEQILIVKILKNKKAFSVNFYLRDDFDKSNKLLHIIYNHLTTIKIVQRLDLKLNTYFDGKRKDYNWAKEEKILDVWRKILENETKNFREDYGVNYWKYAVNTAILESKEFFD